MKIVTLKNRKMAIVLISLAIVFVLAAYTSHLYWANLNKPSQENRIAGGDMNQDDHWDKLRQIMVRDQLKGRDITDPRLLEEIGKLQRHLFVPSQWRAGAYEDSPQPIGHGQTISQPYIVALMTQLLGIIPGDKVLEIGTGSGYQAALLARLGAEVYTIEYIPALAKQAEMVFRDLGLTEIHTKTGDGYFGWPEKAPFDKIIITAAAPQIPKPLILSLIHI